MIKAIAIDDEPMPLKILARYIARNDDIRLLESFTSTAMAKKWLSTNECDLLFLDINMPAISGLDFFKSLEKNYMVIFTTAYAKYAVDGFELKAIDYLLKPYGYERFLQAVEKAKEYHHFQEGKKSDHIFIKADYSVIKVFLAEIELIEAYTDYLKIYRDGKKMLTARMTMNSIISLLPSTFLRVHRSYIVPLEKVQKVEGKLLYLTEKKVPVGKTYHKTVAALFGKSGNK